MTRTLLLLTAILLATGCVRQEVVVKTTTTYASMDNQWLAPCPLVEPPDGIAYIMATPQGKADMWARKYLDQAGINGDCNIRLKAALDYNIKKAAEKVTITCTEDGVCK